MVALHVQQLDRKHIGGPHQLVERENQRSGIFLPHPPFRDGVQALELSQSGALDHAQRVQIGMLLLEFAGDSRAIEHHGLQIVARRRFQPRHQLTQFCFHLLENLAIVTNCPRRRRHQNHRRQNRRILPLRHLHRRIHRRPVPRRPFPCRSKAISTSRHHRPCRRARRF